MLIRLVWMGTARSYLDNCQRETPRRGHVRRDPGDEPVPASLPAHDRHLPPTRDVTGWRDGNEHDRDHRDQQCEARTARDPGPAKPLHGRITRLDRLQQGCPLSIKLAPAHLTRCAMTRIVTTHDRTKRPPGKLIHIVMRLLAALALSTTLAVAQKTVPGDRVYELHSEAQGSCPSLNWHMVASPDNVLTGMVAWDNRKVVAMVTRTIMPPVQVERFGKPPSGNPQSWTLQAIATVVGGQNRVANISGTIEPNGWLSANIQGPGVACQNIKVPLFVPATPG